MESLSCYFCDRINPGDALYCNGCGTPLAMKPCRQCDAVNAREAERCFRCDAVLSVPADVHPSAAPVRVAPSDAMASPSEQDSASVSVVQRAGEQIEALRRALHESRNAAANGAAPAAISLSPDNDVAAAPESGQSVMQASASALEDVTAQAPPLDPDESALPQPAETPPEDVAAQFAPADSDVPLEPTATSDGAYDSIVRDLPEDTQPEPAQWQVDDMRLQHVQADAPREPPAYRPARARAAVLVALFVVAMAIPAALYVDRHPQLLAEWLPALSPAQAPASEATPPQAAAPAPASAAGDQATESQTPAESPPAASEATASVPPLETQPGDAQPADAQSAPAPEPPRASSPTPDAATTTDRPPTASSSRAETARNRTRTPTAERATAPRAATRPTREREPAEAPIRGEACTPAVAALGLCTPEPRR
jgi:hypothetical protein